MGREATALVRWQGQETEAKILLEAHELIVRGAIKARIGRSSITAHRAAGDWLIVDVGGQQLAAALGDAQAARWSAALAKPPPTLAEKLGIGAQQPAFVVGSVDDAALHAALAGATAPTLSAASVLVAVLMTEADVDGIIAVGQSAPALPIWCVYAKGADNRHLDGLVRTRLRSAGYVDTKTSGVSDALTATRYAPRR